jgi:hypothetical protein
MHLTGTRFLFWAAGLSAHCLLLVVIFTRHRAKSFPVFTTLVAMNVVNAIVLYEVANRGSKRLYLVVYFLFAVLDLILQFSVTYELSRHLFCPTGTWALDVQESFFSLAVMSIVVASALASLPTPPEKRLLAALLDKGNIFSAALQCELFVGMIAFSATARLPWKTHVARIAQGLGFFSLIGLLTDAGHSAVARNSALFQELTSVRMLAYLICAGYWIVALFFHAPEPKELPEKVRRQLFLLHTKIEYDLRKLRMLMR